MKDQKYIPMKRGFQIGLVLFTLLNLTALVPIASALEPAAVPPDFSLVSLDGSSVSIRDFRGKVVYLDFWASWCGPCRHTLPWMQEVQRRYKSQGLEVVAVNLDSKRADARKLLDELNPSFTVLFDPSGTAASKYQLPSMPSSFLIDKSGRIAAVHPGFREGDEKMVEAQIEKLLKAGK